MLLITSRTSRSWSLAKGNVDRSSSATEAARQEAFEEAGVLGYMQSTSIGYYTHHKSTGGAYRVEVFKMHVQRELAKWPESNERERRWVSIETALELISNPSLRRLLRAHFHLGASP